MNEYNVILDTDSYKCSMFKQYPPGTQYIYSYIESRGGLYDQTVMFGLQAFIKEYLLEPITQADIDVADEILASAVPPEPEQVHPVSPQDLSIQ